MSDRRKGKEGGFRGALWKENRFSAKTKGKIKDRKASDPWERAHRSCAPLTVYLNRTLGTLAPFYLLLGLAAASTVKNLIGEAPGGVGGILRPEGIPVYPLLAMVALYFNIFPPWTPPQDRC